jgi:hypothetical protein
MNHTHHQPEPAPRAATTGNPARSGLAHHPTPTKNEPQLATQGPLNRSPRSHERRKEDT